MLSFSQFTFLKEEAEAAAAAKPLSAGKQWHVDHPVDHMNIVAHFDEASKDEHHHGMNWYRDAHQYAKDIGKSTGMSTHAIAGLASTYSPQTDWHSNMINAARVARSKKAVGGLGQPAYHKYGKAFATGSSKDTAQRILGGESYETALKGQKTKAFARLIEHGGDKDPGDPQVVVDRHAHSVASGSRITDAAFGSAGLSGKKKYGELKAAYTKAAEHINNRTGAQPGESHYVHPHQVQSVTWLVRQRLNDQEEARGAKTPKAQNELHKTAIKRDAARKNWRNYAGTWHPGLAHMFEGREY